MASPLDILQTWVGANNLEWEQADDGTWTSVKIDGKYYTLDEFGKQSVILKSLKYTTVITLWFMF